MARDFSKKFTDSYIHGIKPTDKEQLFSDRDNLYLLVKTNWGQNMAIHLHSPNNQKRIKNLLETIHQFYLLSLGRRLVYGAGYWHKNIDPAEEECMQQEEKEKKSVTFKELAMLWRDKRLKKGELKENSIEKVYRSVELYLFDRFNFSRLLAKNINLRSLMMLYFP